MLGFSGGSIQPLLMELRSGLWASGGSGHERWPWPRDHAEIHAAGGPLTCPTLQFHDFGSLGGGSNVWWGPHVKDSKSDLAMSGDPCPRRTSISRPGRQHR